MALRAFRSPSQRTRSGTKRAKRRCDTMFRSVVSNLILHLCSLTFVLNLAIPLPSFMNKQEICMKMYARIGMTHTTASKFATLTNSSLILIHDSRHNHRRKCSGRQTSREMVIDLFRHSLTNFRRSAMMLQMLAMVLCMLDLLHLAKFSFSHISLLFQQEVVVLPLSLAGEMMTSTRRKNGTKRQTTPEVDNNILKIYLYGKK